MEVLITQLKKKESITNLCEFKAKKDIKMSKLPKSIGKIVALIPGSI